MVDAHVHFWDPEVLSYPWLDDLPALRRRFLTPDYVSAAGEAVERIVFVEANCRPGQNVAEAELVQRWAQAEPRVAAVVAFADLTDTRGPDHALAELADLAMVRGIRQNIQGQPPGFALQAQFVRGVRAVGRRGLTFDLCVTHDQLAETIELVAQCPETAFVLDHCGKPGIRARALEPWRTEMEELAAFPNVWCKLSGLLTEAERGAWREEDLFPYAQHAVDVFGADRLMFGSDWPVLTLAGGYDDWLDLTRRFTAGWSEPERQRFYHDNAVAFYGLASAIVAGDA